MSGAEKSKLLVSVEQLRAQLHDARWCVVDVRHDLFDAQAGIRAYEEGHIPGAVFANIDTQLSGKKTGLNGRHPLPLRDDLVASFRAWGINSESQIVAYDAQGGQFASRLWWLARWLGHHHVALLDGGWPKWLQQTSLSSRQSPARPPGNFTANDSLLPLATVDDVMQSLDGGDRMLIDARTSERYRGEQEPIDPVAGHIPGAFNRPWQQNLNPDQTFKPARELRSEFDARFPHAPAIASRISAARVSLHAIKYLRWSLPDCRAPRCTVVRGANGSPTQSGRSPPDDA